MSRSSVLLILFDELDEAVLQPACRRVEAALGCSVKEPIRAPCDVPSNISRSQKLADIVLKHCVLPYRSATKWVVGLTGADLYSHGLNFVFGLADARSGCAVVSWHRLVGESSIWTLRLAKEIVHEVGHLHGLRHCPNPRCIMWFSNTLAETNRKDLHFCGECRLLL